MCGRPRPRVLTIVLCETRAWQVTWPSLRTHVLEQLDSDLALCISDRSGSDDPLSACAEFTWILEEPDDWGELFSRVAGNDDWRTLLEVDEELLGGVADDRFPPRGSGAIIMYFRHFLGECIATTAAAAEYDWYLVIRSDFVWTVPHPSLALLDPDGITVLDGEAYGGVSDRYAAIPASLMPRYLDIVEPMFFDPIGLRAQLESAIGSGHVLRANPEQFLKVRMMGLGLWEGLNRIPYLGYAVRLPGGSTRWQGGRYSRRLGYFVKYEREYAAASALARWVRRPDHWKGVLHGRGFRARGLDWDTRLALLRIRLEGRIRYRARRITRRA